MVSLEFFIDIILLTALWPWGWLSLSLCDSCHWPVAVCSLNMSVRCYMCASQGKMCSPPSGNMWVRN